MTIMTISNFIKTLKTFPLTKHQRKTLRGQAIAGDIEGAKKGLAKLLKELTEVEE